MSGEQGHTTRRHIAGLMVGAVAAACLASLWIDGPSLLRGTMLEDLFSVLYVGLVAAILAIADRIADRLIGH